jgi:hypothetical protein
MLLPSTSSSDDLQTSSPSSSSLSPLSCTSLLFVPVSHHIGGATNRAFSNKEGDTADTNSSSSSSSSSHVTEKIQHDDDESPDQHHKPDDQDQDIQQLEGMEVAVAAEGAIEHVNDEHTAAVAEQPHGG